MSSSFPPHLCACLSVNSELEEEMVFEEFKRSYLKGMIDDEEEGNVSGGDAAP